jgi:hypothetical protein
MRNYVQNFYWKVYEQKTPLGRTRHSWEDNTKMDRRELGVEGVRVRIGSSGGGLL